MAVVAKIQQTVAKIQQMVAKILKKMIITIDCII